jgi:hypothetical protein
LRRVWKIITDDRPALPESGRGQAPAVLPASRRTERQLQARRQHGAGQATACNCDPSYPDFCIPPPPDLDCADINARNFTVLPPDPHGFDREGDGLGCES